MKPLFLQPRDECISNLMKAIKLEDSKQIQSKTETKKTKVTEEEVLQDELKEEGSWEDLASDEVSLISVVFVIVIYSHNRVIASHQVPGVINDGCFRRTAALS